MRGRYKIALLTALSALAVSAFGASSAWADEYSCTFTGAAGPVEAYDNVGEEQQEDGVEAISEDAQNDEGDGDNILNDTDDGDGDSETEGQDGSYSFTTDAIGGAGECLFVENADGPTEDDDNETGVYDVLIESAGEYNNTVCGTGYAIDDTESTTVESDDPGFSNITDADYRIDFEAGQGPIDIRDVLTADGEIGGEPDTDDGAVSIAPTTGTCAVSDVTEFRASGTFTGSTVAPPS